MTCRASGSRSLPSPRAATRRSSGEPGLSWHAILPLPKAEFARDFSPPEWAVVEQALGHAEHVRVITENGTREDAYLDCGMETVNGSDVLLAVWDGQPARGKGGTAEVVEYARSLGKPLVVIDAATLEVRRENFEKLERRDAGLAHLNHLPVFTTGWGENPFDAPDRIFAFQQKCDYAASRGAPQFRRLIVLTVLLHVAATLIAAAALAFGLHFIAVPWLKLLCLASALGVIIRTTAGCSVGWHQSFAGRRWPRGACRARRPSSRTSNCPAGGMSRVPSASCTSAPLSSLP